MGGAVPMGSGQPANWSTGTYGGYFPQQQQSNNPFGVVSIRVAMTIVLIYSSLSLPFSLPPFLSLSLSPSHSLSLSLPPLLPFLPPILYLSLSPLLSLSVHSNKWVWQDTAITPPSQVVTLSTSPSHHNNKCHFNPTTNK